MPIHKVLLWSGFGIAVRLWQLGIEMRPFFNKHTIWAYPIYGSIGGAFGYWLQGVEQRQISFLSERKENLQMKRQRRAERDAGLGLAPEEGRQKKLLEPPIEEGRSLQG